MSNKSTIRKTDFRKSKTGLHYSFEQIYYNKNGEVNYLPVYGTQIKVKVNFESVIETIFENTYDLSDVKVKSDFIDANAVTETFVSKNNFILKSPAKLVLFVNQANKAYAVAKIKAESKDENSLREYLVNEDGEVLYSRDVRNYYHSKKHGHGFRVPKLATSIASSSIETPPTPETNSDPIPDLEEVAGVEDVVTATAYVFLPDPLTSAGVAYGTPGFVDDNDENSPELNAERQEVQIEVLQKNDGLYYLENDYVAVKDVSAPLVPVVAESELLFDYTRDESGFEDVNAFFHISNFQEYLQSLGFNLHDDKAILIDTHANNGDDNSYQQKCGNTSCLYFGEGGIDDAEDADVVVHEYSHALSEEACPNCNSGEERRAIDEALGDYFATSYSVRYGAENWQKMFTWDGNTAAWQGRDVASDKHYPEANEGSIYQRSEIFSSVLMEINQALGGEVTDELVVEAMYNFAQGIKMTTAARILLQTDDALNGGENYETLFQLLFKRGLLEYEVDAGQNQTICSGETTSIGGVNTELLNADVYWTPRTSLDDHTAWMPNASPDQTTTYTLNVVDINSNTLYQDSVTVMADYCFGELPSEITVLNTEKFMKGLGNIIVEVPENTATTTIDLFDMYGRLIRSMTTSAERVEVLSGWMYSGMYLLRIQADDNSKTMKLMQTRR
ncbi:MAG: T9SS type A sorting domain-containing protein, partial [Chitinophagales bacterium]